MHKIIPQVEHWAWWGTRNRKRMEQQCILGMNLPLKRSTGKAYPEGSANVTHMLSYMCVMAKGQFNRRVFLLEIWYRSWNHPEQMNKDLLKQIMEAPPPHPYSDCNFNYSDNCSTKYKISDIFLTWIGSTWVNFFFFQKVEVGSRGSTTLVLAYTN